MIGSQWDKNVKNISGEVVLPGEVKNNLIWCFGHGPFNGKVDIPNKNKCNFSVTNLPKKQFLEIRMLFDKDLIRENRESLVAKDARQLSDLLSEEKKFAAQTERQKNSTRILTIVFSLIPILGFGVFIKGALAYFRDWWKYGRDLPLPRINLADKLHEPPSNLAPAMVDCLLKTNKNISSKVFLSTILSLVLKRVIKIKSVKQVKKGISSLFCQTTTYKYSLFLL